MVDIGIQGTGGKLMQVGVDGRLYSIYLCTEGIQLAFYMEVQVGAVFDLFGIPFRN